VARVVAFVPDLLFGSNVLGALRAAGHEVRLVVTLDETDLHDTQVLVIDLTDDATERITVARSALSRAPEGLRTLAFFSHVEADVRDAARAAGFDLVVPRSRMARAAGELVDQLAPSTS
jgi:nucleoside-diphosphate-sugar epimerase